MVAGHCRKDNGSVCDWRIPCSQPAAEAPGVLRLKLLSREKVYDFDNYLAPSVTDAHAKKAMRRHPEAYGENAPLPIQ
jgi:hypothetical protein